MNNNKYLRDDHRFDKYIDLLVKEGAIIHDSISPAIFSLNNGLQYSGLKVNKQVKGENILVLIPVELLLTAYKAFQQKQLKQVFEEDFYRRGAAGQDRIMVTYLLFIYYSKPQSIWSQMIKNFDKQIDILSFWNEEDLNKFRDKSILHAKRIDLNAFQQQWRQFQQIKNSYEVLQSQIFTKENYKWIYIHVISRCFGSLMNSVYMTPFCQFFNHHCVSVSYTCLTKEDYQKQVNKNKQQKNKQDLSDGSGSFSTNNSVDYVQEGDFNYWQVDTYQIKWGGKISFDLKEKQTKLVQTKIKQITQNLSKDIVWSGFNLIYIGQIIQKINIIKNQYMAGRRKMNQTSLDIEKTKQHVQNYKKEVTEFYRRNGFNYRPKTVKTNHYSNQANINETSPSSTSLQKSQPMPPTKQYVYFRMGSRKQAIFQQGQQIYFCYGNFSNRQMLIRYGCCIQQNHYDHVWLKFFMGKDFSPYPDLLNLITQKGLPITFKTKLKPYTFAFEPVLLMKMRKWRLTHDTVHDIFYITNLNVQIQAFQNLKPIYEEEMKKYVYADDLTDKSIGYHEYFTRVYHKQKMKILKLQIELLDYLIVKFNQMKIQKNLLDLDQKYQKYLKYYWKGFKGMIW